MEKSAVIINNQFKKNVFIAFLLLLRPKQWTKNLLIFAALIFSQNLTNIYQLILCLYGFILFSFVAGSVYVLNDYVDREKDKLHPEKKHRPLASGLINAQLSIVLGSVLFIASLSLAFIINWIFALLLLLYFILNVAYSFHLKNVVLVDIMIIAAGFVIRALCGGVIIQVSFTPWFLICTMLLALFLAVSKRRHELILMKDNTGSQRKVLQFYSPELLNQLISIVTTATIISYALFTFTSGRTTNLMWTIPFVIYGIFRYLFLIYIEGKGGRPEKLLIEDKHILLTVLFYVLTVILILYFS